MQTLSRDKSLDAFRVEYEKLYRTLKHSHEQEKKLEKKCKSLSEECRQLTAKGERLRMHSREDETQIETLKAELESAWRQADDASDLEMAGKEQIAKLRVEIAELTRRCEMAENGEEEENEEESFDGCERNHSRRRRGHRQEDDEDDDADETDDYFGGRFSTTKVSGDIVRRLQREKESLQLERDEKVDEVVQLRQDISQQRERARTAETKKLDLECECAKLKDIARAKGLEAEKSDTKRERLERELMHAKSMIESKQGEISRMKAQAVNLELKNQKLADEQRKSEHRVKNAQKECNAYAERTERVRREVAEITLELQRVNEVAKQKEIETEKLKESAAKIERETKKIIQVKEAALRKLKQAENAKIESEHKRDDLKLEISRIERVVEEQRRNIELERRAKEDLMREKEALAKQTS